MKERNVRCSGPTLYWGNCDNELCNDADCRRRCDENDQCNFYASWKSGHCETYESCPSTAADGGLSIDLWSKSKKYILKETDVRCSSSSLYWGNCDDNLCSDADCRLRCDENDLCKFYASWESGHCETYESCPSTASDGGLSINLWSKIKSLKGKILSYYIHHHNWALNY